jgi:PKD repeat protein
MVVALAVSIPWLAQAMPSSGESRPASTTPQNPSVSTPQTTTAKVPRQKPALPALTLSADNLNPPRGQPVHFTAAWSRDMPQMVYRFDWGDGQAADTQEPAADHAYAREGSYTVRLTARPVKGTAAQVATPISSNELSITVVAQPPPSRARAPETPKSLREPLQPNPPAVRLPPQAPLPLVLTLAADTLTPQSRQSVRFTGSWNRRVAGVLYRFDWGDGQRTDSKTPQAEHAYSAPGRYVVRLVATAAVTEKEGPAQPITSNELAIEVRPDAQEPQRPPAVLRLAANNATPFPGDTVRFTATWDRDMPQVAYRFDWGDGQSLDTKVPQADHAYSAPGEYTVRLAAVPVSPATAGRTRLPVIVDLTIDVVPRPRQEPPPQAPLPPPVLTLAADTLTPQSRQSVRFTGSWNRRVAGVRYRFDWGDGQRTDSETSQADHAYAAPGRYAVRLVATAASEGRRGPAQPITSNALAIEVRPDRQDPQRPPAVLTLAADNPTPFPGDAVRFTASWNRDMPQVAYRFDWGDGQIIDTKVPQADHAYSAHGVYAVRVTASPLAAGLTNDPPSPVVSNELTIRVATPPPEPVATLAADHQEARVGEPITFTVSLNPQSDSAQYRFVFGDGNRQDSLRNEVVYAYAREGDFQPWVTVSIDGRDQAVNSAPIPLAIRQASSPALTVELLSQDPATRSNVDVKASLNPPQNVVRYQFSWGDESPPDEVGMEGMASHRYARPGRYTVLVTASTEEPFPAPLQQTLIVGVRRALWPLTGGEWLLVLAAGAAAGTLFRWLKRPSGPVRPPGLHVTGFSGSSAHQLVRAEGSVSHPPLILKPGMDSAAHDVVFSGPAAASDQEEHRA